MQTVSGKWPGRRAARPGYDHGIVSPVASAPIAVTARVPAKVNLQLAVGPAGPDGYHGVVTVYQAISLYDEVTVEAAERTTVLVTGLDAELVPTGPTNLASKAVTALARAAGLGARPGVAIEIRKRIPMAAGLAGGSADAAATLVACNELWQAGLSQAQLAKVAARLGSDVPFSLAGGTAVGRGRGELLTPALVSGTYHWALAFAADGLSTPEVYATCDRLRAARLAGPPGIRAVRRRAVRRRAVRRRAGRDPRAGAQRPADDGAALRRSCRRRPAPRQRPAARGPVHAA